MSHTLILVVYARRSEFTKFEVFGESKCPGNLNFLWNFFRTHYIAVRWCNSKWTLGHRRKGGGYNTSSPILFCNTFYRTPIKKITFFRKYSDLEEKCKETNCRSSVIILYIHGLCIGWSEVFQISRKFM